jgi:hypothetical protein
LGGQAQKRTMYESPTQVWLWYQHLGEFDMANWIKAAIKHPGRMKNLAKKHGISTQQELQRDKSKGGSLGHAARMGITLSHMHKK